MDRRGNMAAFATLAVGLVTLALVTALTFRAAPAAHDAVAQVASLQADVAALRDDIAELRQVVEDSTTGPADLSAIERRLDGLDGQLRTMSANVDAMNTTASKICQLVADSPFTPGDTC